MAHSGVYRLALNQGKSIGGKAKKKPVIMRVKGKKK